MRKRTNGMSSTLSQPLEKRSVVKLVIDRIRDAVLSKEIGPGDYLPSENELTQSLGVGKTSVREAIKMLEAMGIVEVSQGRGTVIRKEFGADSLSALVFQLMLEQGSNQQLLELRSIFEPAYTQLALRKASDEDLDRLEANLERFERKIHSGDQTAEDDLSFHQLILEITGNPFIVRVGTTIHQLFTASVGRSMRTIPETALKDHRAIYDAFRSRDPERLSRAVLESFKGWESSLNR